MRPVNQIDTIPAEQLESEADFQVWVVGIALLGGWKEPWHDVDSRKNDPGFPDLVLRRPETGELIWVELKDYDGKLTPAQREWRDDLRACGQEWHCWRPQDREEVKARLLKRGSQQSRTTKTIAGGEEPLPWASNPKKQPTTITVAEYRATGKTRSPKGPRSKGK